MQCLGADIHRIAGIFKLAAFSCAALSSRLQRNSYGQTAQPTLALVTSLLCRSQPADLLREAARAVLPQHGADGCDYVLIGRAEVTANRPYDLLIGDLRYALKKLHAQK